VAEGTTIGTLFLVSTPIGNLEDITRRALRILGEVDLIAAEDTRKTGILLTHFGIDRPLLSFHAHNEARRVTEVLGKLTRGQSVALVTDAGTPGISDPAYLLVEAAIEAGVPIVPVPGPTAFVPALVVSGLPTDRFVFEGFLPAKKGRSKRLGEIAAETRTVVLYESPHRIARTIGDLHRACGDRRVVIVREITKKFEETIRGTLGELSVKLGHKSLKGEMVIVVEGLRESTHRSRKQIREQQAGKAVPY